MEIPGDTHSVIGAVLAGGAGSRMGLSKATVTLLGRPLIAYPLEAVRAAGLAPVVVAKQSTELPDLDAPLLFDRSADRHPLHGVIASLEAGGGRPVIAVACDMPLITPGLLAWLARVSGVAVPRVEGVLQPLLARYEAGALDLLRLAVGDGQSARRAVSALMPRLIEEPELAAFGDPFRLFFNVNDSEHLRRAAVLLQSERTAAGREGS